MNGRYYQEMRAFRLKHADKITLAINALRQDDLLVVDRDLSTTCTNLVERFGPEAEVDVNVLILELGRVAADRVRAAAKNPQLQAIGRSR